MKRILISRLSALGDVVCSLPAAVALRGSFPDSEITWVVDPRFAGIVECCSAVDQVIRAKPGFKPSSWPSLEGEFDAALDLQGLLKSAIVVGRAKADRKLGYHWQREGAFLFSQAVLPDPTSMHVVDQYVDVARAAIDFGLSLPLAGELAGTADGRNSPEKDPNDARRRLPNEAGTVWAEFALTPKDEDVENLRGKVPSEFVAINAGAGWASKRWPPGHFAKLIDLLADRAIPTVLIGGPAAVDREAAQEAIQSCASKPIDMVGKTSVRELVALLSFAKAHIGGDTGSTHITAALGRPAIGLYSITRPERSCPYGQRQRCHYSPEGLATIRPEEVMKTVMEAIA